MTELVNEKLKEKRSKYYNQLYTKYNLVEAMKDREVVLMSYLNNRHCIRGLRITSTQFLETVFRVYKFFDKDYNIYVSVAKYKHIPTFDMRLENGIRSKETRKWFAEKSEKEIYSYDMLLDFDSKGRFRRMVNEVSKMLYILKLYKIPHNCFPSGKNYQIIIQGECFEKVNFIRILRITEQIKERFNLQTLDLIGIGNKNKIRKCEYSVVLNKVCLPVKNMENLINYHPFNIDVVLSSVLLYKRGLMWNFDELPKKEKINNFDRFLKEHLIDGG